ncbi:MAG: Fic family protein [Acidobacteriota bacterium]
MREAHNVEWKESWRDEYLRWICGFANAEGGVLHIGRNEKGEVVGLSHAAKLLQDIPNKVRDILGILVKVNLRTQRGKEWLEIVVEPYPYPVSYKGEYHLRSGSTKQELKGAALDRFLLRKQGRTWDGVPVPGVSPRDLSKEPMATFRKLAKDSRRLDTTALREPAAGLLDKLNLFDGDRLKRAALLLFHPDPERFVTGAFVKIGYFRTESELLYHDEVHGDLFTQAQQTMDRLLTKYLKAAISYRGIQRVEALPVPEAALREALLNAIIHKDYASGSPIQIRVYADKLKIWNAGELPGNWTVEDLRKHHPSRPFNPSVANAFFRSGQIEAWGRGFQLIFDACREEGVPEPAIGYQPGDVWIEFPFRAAYLAVIPTETTEVATEVTTEVTTEVAAARRLLAALRGEMSRQALQAALGLANDTHFRKAYLQPALAAGLIEMTIPEKPTSRMQRYRLTKKGSAALKGGAQSGGEM